MAQLYKLLVMIKAEAPTTTHQRKQKQYNIAKVDGPWFLLQLPCQLPRDTKCKRRRDSFSYHLFIFTVNPSYFLLCCSLPFCYLYYSLFFCLPLCWWWRWWWFLNLCKDQSEWQKTPLECMCCFWYFIGYFMHHFVFFFFTIAYCWLPLFEMIVLRRHAFSAYNICMVPDQCGITWEILQMRSCVANICE